MASMNARGARPSCRARFSLMSNTADAPVRDGLGDDRRGTQAGDAVRGNRLCLYMRRETRFEHDLAGKVRLMALGHDCTESNGVDPLRIDLVAIEEPAHRMFRERRGADRRKRLPGLDERRARAGNNGDPVITHAAFSFALASLSGARFTAGCQHALRRLQLKHQVPWVHQSDSGAPARNCRNALTWRGAPPRNGSIPFHPGGWEA